MNITTARPPVGIRPFRAADQPAACRLILAGLAEHFPELDPAYNPDLTDIWHSYVVPGHLFIIAEQSGVLIGTGGLLIAGDAGQVVRVSVAPAWRGRGIGRSLVEHLVASARVRGLARVWMETNDDWHAALGLYARCGFREFDRRDGCVFMTLALHPAE